MKRTTNTLLVCKIDVTESEKEDSHTLEMIQGCLLFPSLDAQTSRESHSNY